MENLFLEYMNRRLSQSPDITGGQDNKGPVITISRQTGCGATGIAGKLSLALSRINDKHDNRQPWNYMNREILEKAAEKLNLEPYKLDRVLTDKDRGYIDEVVEAFSGKTHKSDTQIIKTFKQVIHHLASQGHIIIVGRGGAVICNDIPASLHIRLEAPENWRTELIMKRLGYDRSQAVKYITKNDEERLRYVKLVLTQQLQTMFYDLTINRSRFTEDEVVEMILNAAQQKKLI